MVSAAAPLHCVDEGVQGVPQRLQFVYTFWCVCTTVDSPSGLYVLVPHARPVAPLAVSCASAF